MKRKYGAVLLVVDFLLGAGVSVGADEQFTARQFAGTDGKLDKKQAAVYIIFRDDEPLSKFMVPGQTTLHLDTGKLAAAMEDKLDDLRSNKKIRHDAPWTWEELDNAFPPVAPLPFWMRIDAVTKKKTFGDITVGPFRLRKSTGELAGGLSDAKGVTLAFSENRLVRNGRVRNSEGVLDYPVKWNACRGGSGKSVGIGLDFAGEWNVSHTKNDPGKSVEELTFSIPLTLYVSPGAVVTRSFDGRKPSSRLLLVQCMPYYLTDFDFVGSIYGIEATGEFIGNVFGVQWLYLGGFQDIGLFGMQYQLRVIPKLDYSVTRHTGIYTTRKEGDDWLRLGGAASFALRLTMQNYKALDIGGAYQLHKTVSGSGGYSSLLKTNATLWLMENIGATIEYSKGDTPVADKAIDLISFGIELKY